MPYDVVIRRMSDGVERVHHEPSDWANDDDDALFWWEDGNNACDCSRHRMFQAAGGENLTEHDCTSCAYRVERYQLPDGRVIAGRETT